jgi:hypothetical protein
MLGEVVDTSILRTELSNGYWDSSRPTNGLSVLAPAQRAEAKRLCALAHRDKVGAPRSPARDPTETSCEPVSMSNDLWWIWANRAARTNIVASF